MKKIKGWIRYWCCDKSGAGREKWKYIYLPDSIEFRLEDIWEYIQYTFEPWTIHGSYTYDIEWTEDINLELIDEEIEVYANKIESSTLHINELKKQRKKLENLNE